ncbi:hypothetical protein [Larkinella terrae]|uniref:Uncharacterized protein n=1 Tax=Larkinella terrae TaxID=2025311 RepID=A0A7K0ED33_9BACT|nr:hypothetical protein [Larkinella terrae]MRS59814.1 hypothetical protein [Larkinella terrae]
MAKSKIRFVVSLDTYLSILAVVSSFCAIGITFYQAYLQRAQQYASVMPVLDIYHTGRFEDDIPASAITVANFGLGPAFIDSVHYYYGKKRYPDMYSLVKDVLAEDHIGDSTLTVSDLWKDKVIPQGETIYLYKTTNSRAVRHLYRQNDSIATVIYYRSIYGEQWVIDPRNAKEARNRKLD